MGKLLSSSSSTAAAETAAQQQQSVEIQRRADEEKRIPQQLEVQREAREQAQEQQRAQEQAVLAKDTKYRQSLDNPFAAGSADEALSNAVEAASLMRKAEEKLDACRRKAGSSNRPGLDLDKICTSEQTEVRKYQSYQEGWNQAALNRAATDPERIRQREVAQFKQQMIETRKYNAEQDRQEAARADQIETASAEENANPFSAKNIKAIPANVKAAVENKVDEIKDLRDKARDCKNKLLDGKCQ